jgi:hypothetical protein
VNCTVPKDFTWTFYVSSFGKILRFRTVTCGCLDALMPWRLETFGSFVESRLVALLSASVPSLRAHHEQIRTVRQPSGT